LNSSACSQQSKNVTDEKKTGIETIIDDKGDNILDLYYYEADVPVTNLFKKAIEKFNTLYPEAQCKMTGIMEYNQYMDKISTELMAGAGPDVVMFQQYMNLSFRKIMDSGALIDLNDFINTDTGFEADNYKKVILDSGIYKGKRYLIPLYFYIQTYITTDKLLSDNKLKIDLKKWSLDYFQKLLKTLNSEKNVDKKVYFEVGRFTDILNNSGYEYFDYDKKEVRFDTSTFIKILNIYKDLNDACVTNDALKQYNNNYYNVMQDKRLLVSDTQYLADPKYLWTEANYISHYVGSEAKLYPLPTEDGSKNYTAVPECLMAINKHCNDKKLAYSFIKLLLSEEIQSSEIVMGAPVNIKAYEKLLAKYSGEQGNGQDFYLIDAADKFTSKSLSSSLVKDLKYILSNITICKIRDAIVNNLIWEERAKLLNGDCTAEEAARDLQKKVTSYLKE
jgi:ABC-type sugar transport system, periplasmic component